MRKTLESLQIALLLGLLFSALPVLAETFIYTLSFPNVNIGVRYFGRLTGAQDGYEAVNTKDNASIPVTPGEPVYPYGHVYLQGSGMLEEVNDYLQLSQWLKLGQDFKDPTKAASTWVLVIDEEFFNSPVVSTLSMSWSQMSVTNPTGTLQLIKPDGTVAVADMKTNSGPLTFAKEPVVGQLGPGRYEIRYRAAGTTTVAPATPVPIVKEMTWQAGTALDVAIRSSDSGTVTVAPTGVILAFNEGSWATVIPSARAQALLSGNTWQIHFTLPDDVSAFDQVVIGYLVTKKSGATVIGTAESYVTLFAADVPKSHAYSPSQGWNLLAVPPLKLLQNDAGYDALMAFRPLLLNTSPRAYGFLESRASLSPCRAFWLFYPSGSAPNPPISLSGLSKGAVIPSLQSGWNFIGVAEAKTVAALDLSWAWRWGGTYYVLVPQGDTLQPGLGYWLYRE